MNTRSCSLMQQLQAARIVTRNHEERWILARDLEEITLGALYYSGNYYLPLAEEEDLPIEYRWDRSFVVALAKIHDQGEAVLNRFTENHVRGKGKLKRNIMYVQ